MEELSMQQEQEREQEQEHQSRDNNFADEITLIPVNAKVIISVYCTLLPSYSDDPSFDNLKDSIATDGVQQPITAFRDDAGNFVIIDGAHRWAACQELKIPCPAIIKAPLSEEDQEIFAFSSNTLRRGNLSKEFLKASAIRIRKERGFGYKKIGQILNTPDSTIKNWIRAEERQNEGVPNGTLANDPEKQRKEIKRCLSQLDGRTEKYLSLFKPFENFADDTMQERLDKFAESAKELIADLANFIGQNEKFSVERSVENGICEDNMAQI